MDERVIKIQSISYKCRFYYGYNSHYYCTIFRNDDGMYLGELVDVESCDSNDKIIYRIKNEILKI